MSTFLLNPVFTGYLTDWTVVRFIHLLSSPLVPWNFDPSFVTCSVVTKERQTVPVLGGPEVPSARDCTKSGEKCAGAANRPFVEFAECCDERLVCGSPKNPPSGGWGKYCIFEKDAIAGSVDSGEADAEETTAAPPSSTESPGSTPEDEDGAAAGGAVAGGSTSSPDATAEEGAAGGAAGATPTPTEEDDDDGSVCFPASATVELEDGSIIPMSKLAIGDRVKVAVNKYSEVFMFTHKMADISYSFVKLVTVTGAEISLTGSHYIYADNALVAASQVRVGSMVLLGNSKYDKVVSVRSVKGTGLYNPQTAHGDIVVNGIISSTYTTAVEASFAHAILSPFRLVFGLTGVPFTALEKGGGLFAKVALRGTVA